MKNIAFLKTDNLYDYILDEDHLEKALQTHSNINFKYISWKNSNTDWSKYDLVIIRTTWDYTKKPEEFKGVLKKIEQSGAKLLNPEVLVVWNMNKIYLRELKEKGVSIIDSLYFDEENFAQQVKLLNTDRFIVKPRIGAGSEGIFFLKSSELMSSFEEHNQKQSYFVQPFLKEIHKGEVSYFFFNGEFSYAIKKTPKSGEFRVQEEYGSTVTVHEPKNEELFEAKKAVFAVNEFNPLYLRVDAVMGEGGSWKLMELEAIEPSMFFRIVPNSAKFFSEAILSRL